MKICKIYKVALLLRSLETPAVGHKTINIFRLRNLLLIFFVSLVVRGYIGLHSKNVSCHLSTTEINGMWVIQD